MPCVVATARLALSLRQTHSFDRSCFVLHPECFKQTSCGRFCNYRGFEITSAVQSVVCKLQPDQLSDLLNIEFAVVCARYQSLRNQRH